MLDLYINFKNSLQSLMRALEVAVNNAQNTDTAGYKNQKVTFKQVFREAIHSGTVVTNPMHTGSGIEVSRVDTDFSQGSVKPAGPLDVAIVGKGYFLVGDPKQNQFKRNGKFITDFNNQYIIDAEGEKVLGYKVDPNTGLPSDNKLVPIETNGEVDIGFIDGGILVSNFNKAKTSNDISPTPMYRLALSLPRNESGLIQRSGVFQETASSGSRLNPGFSDSAISDQDLSGQYGSIKAESLEGSNFDIAKIALEMNLLQRSVSATQGVIDNVGKVLSGLMSKIGG